MIMQISGVCHTSISYLRDTDHQPKYADLHLGRNCWRVVLVQIPIWTFCIFRSSRYENSVRSVVRPCTSDEICIEHGAAGGDSNYKAPIDVIILDDIEDKAPIEVTILDDSEDEAPIEVIMLDDSEDEGVIQLIPSLEEQTKDEEKASAGNGVPTNTLRQTEQRPCLDKGKSIIIEVEDDGEEFDRQSQETRKAIGESSRPWGDTEVEDKDQTSGFLEPSRNLNRGPPYGQAVLDDLNARIASTANTLRNPQQQRRNISSSSTLFFKDISLSLCIPGTEGNQKVKNEGTFVESHRKRKATVDALDNVSESSLKSRRQMEMGKFLQMPFTSCEIIDLEPANTDGSTRPVTTAYAKHGPIPRQSMQKLLVSHLALVEKSTKDLSTSLALEQIPRFEIC